MSTQEDSVPPEEQKALETFAVTRSKLGTAESHQKALSFSPRPSDVFITTTAKAGTTWMSQICHQLRTGGHMDFREITQVVPYMEMALDMGLRCEDEQVAEPRLFKTHMAADNCPKGGKYITVVRDPYDVAPSFFKFLEGWMFEPGSISANVFMQQVWLKASSPQAGGTTATLRGPALRHYMSWWPRRHDKDVLFVFYEDMRENTEREVKRVAEFIGVDDPKALAVALEKSSFEFMYEHRSQFDDNLMKGLRNKAMSISDDAGLAHGKVASGGGKRGLMNDTTQVLIDEAWDEVCRPVTGAQNYSEWRQMWHKELQKS